MSKLMPCLWFDDRGEEAANFYTEMFRACGQDGSVGHVARYGDSMPRPKGSVMTVSFTLAGQISSPSTAARISNSRPPSP